MKSLMLRRIERSLRELNGELSLWDRVVENTVEPVLRWWEHCWVTDKYYKVKNLIINLKLFMPIAWKWRSWDSCYSIDVFCDLLEANARDIKDSNRHVNSERAYRRCLFASRRLRGAYTREPYNDKAYIYLSDNNPFFMEEADGGVYRLRHTYAKSEEYYRKRLKLMQKRIDREIEQEKKEAWAYLNKYIETFWN